MKSAVLKFTFNPIQENTYVVYDTTGECVVIDPGCCNQREYEELYSAIASLQLTPVRLLNTHCHIDHIPGNPFVANTYQLDLEIHAAEIPVLASAPDYAPMFLGYELPEMPEVKKFLSEGQHINFGNTELLVMHTPGHSPGSVSFYNKDDHYIISGDVLFRQSIGRYDLPGANGPQLFQTLKEKFLTLPDETIVYSGHGSDTSIGAERRKNPFLLKL